MRAKCVRSEDLTARESNAMFYEPGKQPAVNVTDYAEFFWASIMRTKCVRSEDLTARETWLNTNGVKK